MPDPSFLYTDRLYWEALKAKGKKVIMIACVVLLALMGSCADDKGPDTQKTAVETKMLTDPAERL